MPNDCPSIARRETEYSLLWAQANPDLFVASVMQFQADNPAADWAHTVDLGRRNFLTLIATRREIN